MKTQYRPIAMRCTQEQFDSINDRIPLPIEEIDDFNDCIYLTNNYGGDMIVSNIYEIDKKDYGRIVFEKFDGELFLDCCGREKEKYTLIGECKGNNGNGCFLDSCGHDCGCFIKVTEQQKGFIIKEYLKNKVWKGSEIQMEDRGEWRYC